MKLFYTISEVASIIGESTTLVRFWSNSFPEYIKPSRNLKQNRMFTQKDLDAIKRIHYLVKEKGLTLDGARAMMKNNKDGVDNTAEIIGRLTAVKDMLLNVRNSLDK
ncbi:MAG: MerR family transcriptional regulator [Bacteroidales bacterium]|nr:MerR family transcriptional regulator [Candidatus Egerieousia equi]